jgi:hypothetical protein
MSMLYGLEKLAAKDIEHLEPIVFTNVGVLV